MKLRNVGVISGLILAVALVSLWSFRGVLATHLMARAYNHALGADPIAAMPDGLHVGLCGSGSPLPDPTRAGPCTVVVAGTHLFVVDSGTGSTKNLSLMGLAPARVEAVFLTHFHSCLLYTSPSPRDRTRSRMPSSA